MNRQYSQKLSDILEYSREEAGRLRCDYIGPEHLLLALLNILSWVIASESEL